LAGIEPPRLHAILIAALRNSEQVQHPLFVNAMKSIRSRQSFLSTMRSKPVVG